MSSIPVGVNFLVPQPQRRRDKWRGDVPIGSAFGEAMKTCTITCFTFPKKCWRFNFFPSGNTALAYQRRRGAAHVGTKRGRYQQPATSHNLRPAFYDRRKKTTRVVRNVLRQKLTYTSRYFNSGCCQSTRSRCVALIHSLTFQIV